MAATYDPFAKGRNYGYAEDTSAGPDGETVAWSIGPSGKGWMAPDGEGCRDGAIGYSSKLGPCALDISTVREGGIYHVAHLLIGLPICLPIFGPFIAVPIYLRIRKRRRLRAAAVPA